ncbi:MAG: hypothetical protein IJ111_03090 [Eggerthellaceae bacterium]|nr:hypothetical protein [Eggerthellaceae bacterium]
MEQCAIRFGKPSVRDRALRAITPVGVSLALVSGMAAIPQSAFADTEHVYESASITVTQRYTNINRDAVFNAYKVFDADIDAANRASNVQWASANAKQATLAFFDSLTGDESYATWLTTKGYTQADAHDNAQNAAEFVAERIVNDANVSFWTGYNSANPAAKVGNSFTDRFARAIAGADPEVDHLTSTTTEKQKYLISGGTEGYYLIASDPSSIGTGEFGSAPMWVPLGGSIATVQAKESGANMVFVVWEDKTASEGVIADSNIGQDLHYAVTASYPENVEVYSSYSDTYTFNLPVGITTKTGTDAARINAEDFQVVLNGTYKERGAERETAQTINGASGVALTVDGQQITVGIDDVQAIVASLREQYTGFVPTTLSVEYDAHLNADAVLGKAGQQTTLVRTHTADPVSLETSNSRTVTLNNATYQAQFTKIDKANQKPLQGAGFYITADTNVSADQIDDSKESTDPVYVQADGSLGVSPYEFVTNSEGVFAVTGLDEGVYTVHENTVPAGYSTPDSDAVLTIQSTLNQNVGTSTFSASVEGGETAEVEGDVGTSLVAVDPAKGLAKVNVANEKVFTMPYTGLEGNTSLYAAAAAIGLGGLAAMFAALRRKRAQGEDR